MLWFIRAVGDAYWYIFGAYFNSGFVTLPDFVRCFAAGVLSWLVVCWILDLVRSMTSAVGGRLY